MYLAHLSISQNEINLRITFSGNKSRTGIPKICNASQNINDAGASPFDF